MFDGNDLFGILIPWNFGARVWVSTFCMTLSCARHQKHPETSRNTESWKCFWTPQRTPKQSSFLKQLAEGQKKNIHKSQWFSGFRPHLHRHQLVDTGIMMYNGAPILPLAFEAFMIPCIRALPTPNWSKTKKAEFHVHFPSLVLDLSGVNAHHHFAQHQKLMASITRYYTYV